MMIECTPNSITMDDFAIVISNQTTDGQGRKDFESSYIQHVLALCLYNQSKAAKKLGMSRGCLRMKMKEYYGDKYFRDSV